MADTKQIEKLPPQNLEAEKSLLGSILIDKDAFMNVMDMITPDDFYKNAHRDILETIIELSEKNEPVDILTLSNRLEEKGQLERIGGRSYLASLSNAVPTASHIKQYATIVQRKSTLRKLLSAADQISRLGYEEDGEDIDKLVDEAQQQVFSVGQTHLKRTFTDIRSVLNDAFERIDELHKEKGKLRGVPTGFRQLDNILAGLQMLYVLKFGVSPLIARCQVGYKINLFFYL